MSDSPWYRASPTKDVQEIHFDYSELERLLVKQSWAGAYEETKRIVRHVAHEAVGFFHDDRLYVEDWVKFPCSHLHTINALWVNHSKERFGLSVQKRIYRETGGSEFFNPEVWFRFCDRVGWHTIDLDFGPNAPVGHLPWLLSPDMVALDSYDGWSYWHYSEHKAGRGSLFLFGIFFDRLDRCGL